MIPLSSLVVFLLAALGLLVVPGPAVIYIVTRSVAQGRKAGIASVLGIELASLCHSVAAAFGLSAILLASSLAFGLVKYLGAAYLIYLGVKTFLSKGNLGCIERDDSPKLVQLFRKGFLVNLLNPKTALFFYAFLPQFVDPVRGSIIVQILMLGAMFVMLATITDSTYALVTSGVGSLVMKSTRFQRVQKYVTGGIYIALGVAAAATGSGKSKGI
jgi:threonine/homoserine/homoserine lactone efflux protein